MEYCFIFLLKLKQEGFLLLGYYRRLLMGKACKEKHIFFLKEFKIIKHMWIE